LFANAAAAAGGLTMSADASAWVFDVSEADFDAKVLAASRDRAVVVDFWAPWCAPCRVLGPVLEKAVAARGGGVLLAKVNIDDNQQLAARYYVEAIPAVKAFRDGRPVREFVGVLPERQVGEFLDSLAPTEAERLASEAGRAADPAEAERLYRAAIDKQPNNPGARVALARLLLGQGKTGGVAELLEPVGTEGELGVAAERLTAEAFLRERASGYGDESSVRRRLEHDPDSARLRYELGVVLAARGDYQGALKALLDAGERDPRLAAGEVRAAMVQVFYALGAQHPLANEYRAKLAGLLY
jgi:putative thioredoxin